MKKVVSGRTYWISYSTISFVHTTVIELTEKCPDGECVSGSFDLTFGYHINVLSPGNQAHFYLSSPFDSLHQFGVTWKGYIPCDYLAATVIDYQRPALDFSVRQFHKYETANTNQRFLFINYIYL